MPNTTRPHLRCRTRIGPRCVAIALIWGVLLAATEPAQANPSHLQRADLIDFDSGELRDGAALLLRRRNELWASVRAGDLDPDAAYTVWWVIFNQPHACAASPCTGNDLGARAVRGAVFYATGFVTGDDGVANVDAHLRAGPLPEGVEHIDLENGFTPGLRRNNGLHAEVHLVIRAHGRRVPGLVATQIGTGEFDDCEVCADQRAAVFLPVR